MTTWGSSNDIRGYFKSLEGELTVVILWWDTHMMLISSFMIVSEFIYGDDSKVYRQQKQQVKETKNGRTAVEDAKVERSKLDLKL